MDQDKRRRRKLKREIKKAGNKRRRQHFKRELIDNPEEAPHSEFDFGDTTSATLNGMDNDATRAARKRKNDEGERARSASRAALLLLRARSNNCEAPRPDGASNGRSRPLSPRPARP
jgi:hypothetical protein